MLNAYHRASGSNSLSRSTSPMLPAAFIEAIDDIRSNIVLRRLVERLERDEINGAIHELVAVTPRDAIVADANGQGEREAPWCHRRRVVGKSVGTEPLPGAFVMRGSVKEETVMDRQENSVLEAGWLLAVPLSIGFTVLIAGLVLG
ncbi:hypothetical protein [Mesorhizobium sp.]|uniref:hypothetical protein n=1 Tax=Mesorhizobium sp. TaxID=1871066 RepID=UPI00257C099A|nr:hypothetical protein [Mesorhizobium sp.]